MKKISNRDVEVVRFKRKLPELKNQAHNYFDKIWQFGYLERNKAYEWLAGWLNVQEPKAHMTNMDETGCKQVIMASIQILNDLRRLDLDWGDEIKHPYYELHRESEEARLKMVKLATNLQ